MKVTVKKADAAESATEKKVLTEQEITEGFVNPSVVLLGFGLSKIPNQKQVDDVVSKIQEAVGKLEYKEGEEPTLKDALHAALDIADAAAALTPSKADDAVVDVAELAMKFVDGEAGFADFFTVLISAKRAKKIAKKEAEQSAKK